MLVKVTTPDYELLLSNNFTALSNTYLDNGRQVSFLSSGIIDFNPTYEGKLLYDCVGSGLYLGTSGNWTLIPDNNYIVNYVSGELSTAISTISGYLESGYIAADLALSGSLVTSISNASGAAVLTASGIADRLYAPKVVYGSGLPSPGVSGQLFMDYSDRLYPDFFGPTLYVGLPSGDYYEREWLQIVDSTTLARELENTIDTYDLHVSGTYASKTLLNSTSGYLQSQIGAVSGSITSVSGLIMTQYPAYKPNQILPLSVTTQFENIVSTRNGVISVGGANSAYPAWQLIGKTDDSAPSDWYLRTGQDETWGTPYRIWHSGDFSQTNINTWNGLQTVINNASGTLNTKIDNVSGALKAQIWASGSIVTAIANASGAAVITASGGAVNVANANTTNVSGALKAQIWASGSIVTAIANASGAAVITASGGAVAVSTTNLNNASGLFLKKDGTTPLTGTWFTGPDYGISMGSNILVGGYATIGLTSGVERLHVKNGDIIVEGSGSYATSGMRGKLYLGDRNAGILAENGFGLKFGVYKVSSSGGLNSLNSLDAMCIKQITGNIGVGNVVPVTKLDVSGVITASGGNSTNWNIPTYYGYMQNTAATTYTPTGTYYPISGTLTSNCCSNSGYTDVFTIATGAGGLYDVTAFINYKLTGAAWVADTNYSIRMTSGGTTILLPVMTTTIDRYLTVSPRTVIRLADGASFSIGFYGGWAGETILVNMFDVCIRRIAL